MNILLFQFVFVRVKDYGSIIHSHTQTNGRRGRRALYGKSDGLKNGEKKETTEKANGAKKRNAESGATNVNEVTDGTVVATAIVLEKVNGEKERKHHQKSH